MKLTTILAFFTPSLATAAVSVGHYHWDVVRAGTVDSFKWSSPFPGDGSPLTGYTTACEEKAIFNATQYRYTDLGEAPPAGVAPWAGTIRHLFTSRAYPGTWQGVNFKGDEREIVFMEYKDVPELARNWIEEQLKDPKMMAKRFMAVLGKRNAEGKVPPQAELDGLKVEDKLFMFAPAEIYDFLPLWVAKGAKGHKCEGK